MALIDR